MSLWDNRRFSEGLSAIKETVEKGMNAAAGLISQKEPAAGVRAGKAYASRFHDLLAENKEQGSILLGHLEKVREYKIAASKNEILEDMDKEIWRAYYREDGVRFFARLLRGYAGSLTEEHSVEDMWIGGYNSAILRILSIIENLEASLGKRRGALEAVPEKYAAGGAVLRSIGYAPCRETACELKTLLDRPDGLDEAGEARVQRLLDRLQREVENNKKAAAGAILLQATPPARRLENEPLLLAMRKIAKDSSLERLETPEGWTPSEYREALREYAGRMAECLPE